MVIGIAAGVEFLDYFWDLFVIFINFDLKVVGALAINNIVLLLLFFNFERRLIQGIINKIDHSPPPPPNGVSNRLMVAAALKSPKGSCILLAIQCSLIHG